MSFKHPILFRHSVEDCGHVWWFSHQNAAKQAYYCDKCKRFLIMPAGNPRGDVVPARCPNA